MVSEDLGKITGYSLTMSPIKGHTLQFGALVVHDFENAFIEGLITNGKQHESIVTHTELK